MHRGAKNTHHCHPRLPPTPSILPIAYARTPEYNLGARQGLQDGTPYHRMLQLELLLQRKERPANGVPVYTKTTMKPEGKQRKI